MNDGSCVRLRAYWRNHVWSYYFVADQTHDGRPLRLLVLVDEYPRDCLAIVGDPRSQSADVLGLLGDLFVERPSIFVLTTARSSPRIWCVNG